MGARYQADYRGIGEHILQAEWMRAHLVERAERLKAAAIAIAPEGDPSAGDEHPGHYKESFEVTSGVQHRKTSRVYARVTNTARYAAAIEFGHLVERDKEGASKRRKRLTNRQRYVEGQHILTKALDGAGDV